MQLIKKNFSKEQEYPLKVIVTGLPRSGTSFLTGCICLMGFNPGKAVNLKSANEYNKWGYFEYIPLNKISNEILEHLGGTFARPPELKEDWLSEIKNKYGKKIVRHVVKNNINVYKDNKLTLLADLYDELFPQVKWIFISRDVEDTYKSRFGKSVSFDKWVELTDKRMEFWSQTKPSGKAMNIHFNDFKTDLEGSILKISTFLDKKLSNEELKNCLNFYKK